MYQTIKKKQRLMSSYTKAKNKEYLFYLIHLPYLIEWNPQIKINLVRTRKHRTSNPNRLPSKYF